MPEYNKKNARRWSVMGERPTFGLTLFELAKDNDDIMAVVADVVNSAGLDRMNKEMPDRIINTGIAEQNMMGIATGLASEGYSVYTASFAPFQAMRCLEQIRVNQGYMGQKLIMAGLASGVAYGELGYTHCCIEDAAILRSIPNIAVVVPADCMETAKVTEAALHYDNSVYIRLMDKTNVPMVYNEDYDFEIGKAVPLIEGGNIAILSNGPMVSRALDAAGRWNDSEAEKVSVYDFHTIKPVDTVLLDKLSTAKAIITVEEHSIVGGLGSAVAEFYSACSKHPVIIRMGIPDEYCHAGSHDYILEKYGLTAEKIFEQISSISAK
ncbi:MAG: transketolase [Lachnospiraceae bacterium]|nr:transketolase [Lachnospiraceae bacterium]